MGFVSYGNLNCSCISLMFNTISIKTSLPLLLMAIIMGFVVDVIYKEIFIRQVISCCMPIPCKNREQLCCFCITTRCKIILMTHAEP